MMKPEITDTGNTTAVFIKGGSLSQHPGWFLQKVNKKVVLPCMADIPFSMLHVTALPSGYWKADHISITPVAETELYCIEGEQFPSERKIKNFNIKMQSDEYQYVMLISEEKTEFSKDFEILKEDWFEDIWFHSEYAYIAYARTKSPTHIPLILDNSNILCISPF